MSPTLRLCSRTREYRRLAATWAASTPSTAWVVEVGCHEGVTSHILAQRNEGRVLAVDRSRHAVQMAQRRFPALHLGVLDASSPRLAEELLLLLHPLGASPADVACYFVDLGGDATLSSVVRALGRLLEQAPKNVEVVVKSEELLRLYRNSQVL